MSNNDYKVADMSLADWGRKEIVIAQSEMPALMKFMEITQLLLIGRVQMKNRHGKFG